jgi:TfoX/Sxy family transcriptional regulator of competence genes
MASDQEFVKFVCELCGAGEISSRRMFGEAAVTLVIAKRVVDS